MIDNTYENSIKSTAQSVSRNLHSKLATNLCFNWGDYQNDLKSFTKSGDTYLTKGAFCKHDVVQKDFEHFEDVKKKIDHDSFQFTSIFESLVKKIDKEHFDVSREIYVKMIRDGVITIYDNRRPEAFVDRSLGIYASVVVGLDCLLTSLEFDEPTVSSLTKTLVDYLVTKSIPVVIEALMGENSEGPKVLNISDDGLTKALSARIDKFSMKELHEVIEFGENQLILSSTWLNSVIGKNRIKTLFPSSKCRDESKIKTISREFLKKGELDEYWNKRADNTYVYGSTSKKTVNIVAWSDVPQEIADAIVEKLRNHGVAVEDNPINLRKNLLSFYNDLYVDRFEEKTFDRILNSKIKEEVEGLSVSQKNEVLKMIKSLKDKDLQPVEDDEMSQIFDDEDAKVDMVSPKRLKTEDA